MAVKLEENPEAVASQSKMEDLWREIPWLKARLIDKTEKIHHNDQRKWIDQKTK